MKKIYEKPELELIDFTIQECVMDTIISSMDDAEEFDPDDIG